MSLTAVVLAAGKGRRMNSAIPKVMHKIAGNPMISLLLDSLSAIETTEVRVVSSHDLLDHKPFQELKKKYGFSTHIQKERHGTADALKAALKEKTKSPVLVMCGDAPLVKPETIKKMVDYYNESEAKLLCLGFEAVNPFGYGRLISTENALHEIIEHKDANPEQKQINICNSGIYIIDHEIIDEVIGKISNANAAEEYYLTDAVKISNQMGHQCVYYVTSEEEVMGINDRKQLAQAEAVVQQRLREHHMDNGVTMLNPSSVYLSFDTKIGKDVIIHQNVVIGEGVEIADQVEIHPFTHIQGATIGDKSNVGPFARIRNKTTIGKSVKIGNFVEVKAINIKNGAKASHLSYLGDGEIGENTNIGAGTIFCNYDGYTKHGTKVGNDVFIGSNSALVAPVNVGERAIIGAGSVITEDVEKDALSIARARQTNFSQKAELIRNKKSGK